MWIKPFTLDGWCLKPSDHWNLNRTTMRGEIARNAWHWVATTMSGTPCRGHGYSIGKGPCCTCCRSTTSLYILLIRNSWKHPVVPCLIWQCSNFPVGTEASEFFIHFRLTKGSKQIDKEGYELRTESGKQMKQHVLSATRGCKEVWRNSTATWRCAWERWAI